MMVSQLIVKGVILLLREERELPGERALSF